MTVRKYNLAFTCILLLALSACSLSSVEQSPMSLVANQSIAPIGYGAQTKGGEGGRVIMVTTVAELRTAIAATGARIVTLAPGTGLLDLMVPATPNPPGQKVGDINITQPFLTLDGSQAPNAQMKGGMFIVKSHDVIFRHLRIRPGDAVEKPDDADPISLNGMTSETYNIVIDHCSLMWGPDMGGLSILNNVHDVTVSNSILGPGLYLSRHSEGVAPDGHSMSTSVFKLDSGQNVAPHNITFYHNLFTSGDRRMPVVYGDNIELVNNVVFNWKRRPMGGNPLSANVLNNYVKAGPETTERVAWSPQIHQDTMFKTFISSSVYEAGTVTDGFTTVRGDPQTVYRTTPWPMTITNPEPAAAAYSSVLDSAGAVPRDSIDARIIQDVRDGTGRYPNADQLDWSTTPGGTPIPTLTQPTATVAVATPTTAAATPTLVSMTPTVTTTPIPPPLTPTASLTPLATVTPTPDTGWSTLACAAGQLVIEPVDRASVQWRCE